MLNIPEHIRRIHNTIDGHFHNVLTMVALGPDDRAAIEELRHTNTRFLNEHGHQIAAPAVELVYLKHLRDIIGWTRDITTRYRQAMDSAQGRTIDQIANTTYVLDGFAQLEKHLSAPESNDSR
ncbi:Uncharacterised protein [Mycobacteroides abscessus subsp. abscessus]|uniref:hypothetical protein n=1 Tax=Mycobacteroides abscessus TaxID=36809 RepID=UPI00092B2CA0|nr:hypothetical protein [Mycobacteroides abscessus]SHS19534.1 Uncharacterised protein [Mycobacteroides abscessus subsp. abscessus]SKN99044.1 Uncharacterised protein [Mycobacteroides abscessus subsp. massiliense]